MLKHKYFSDIFGVNQVKLMCVQRSYLIVSLHKHLPDHTESLIDARYDLYDQSSSFLNLKSRNNSEEVLFFQYSIIITHSRFL